MEEAWGGCGDGSGCVDDLGPTELNTTKVRVLVPPNAACALDWLC